jgi:hypothetical protein
VNKIVDTRFEQVEGRDPLGRRSFNNVGDTSVQLQCPLELSAFRCYYIPAETYGDGYEHELAAYEDEEAHRGTGAAGAHCTEPG